MAEITNCPTISGHGSAPPCSLLNQQVLTQVWHSGAFQRYQISTEQLGPGLRGTGCQTWPHIRISKQHGKNTDPGVLPLEVWIQQVWNEGPDNLVILTTAPS